MNKLLYSICCILLFILNCSNAKSIPVSSFIVEPSGIDTSIYTESKTEYKVESSDEDFRLFAAANQHIISSKTDDGKSTELISCDEYQLPAEKDLSDYLGNTSYINTDNVNIRKAAAAFKNSKDPVSDVSLFVYNHISDKKIGIPFLPAALVLKGKAGDCTEHSVLTISILRTLRIPARAVMGLILTENFSGKENVIFWPLFEI